MARSAALLLAVALITYPLQSHAGCTPAVSLAVAFLSALPQSFAGSQLAQNWTAASYPNPQVDVTACGRGLKSFICDPDGVMTRRGADILEGAIKRIAAGLSPYGSYVCGSAGFVGFQLAFALTRSIFVRPSQDSGVAAVHFAQALHRDWGVGHPDCVESGVLVLFVQDSKLLYISPGQGTRDHLTDDQLDVIIARAASKLRESDYDAALQGVAEDIGLVLGGQTLQAPNTDKQPKRRTQSEPAAELSQPAADKPLQKAARTWLGFFWTLAIYAVLFVVLGFTGFFSFYGPTKEARWTYRVVFALTFTLWQRRFVFWLGLKLAKAGLAYGALWGKSQNKIKLRVGLIVCVTVFWIYRSRDWLQGLLLPILGFAEIFYNAYVAVERIRSRTYQNLVRLYTNVETVEAFFAQYEQAVGRPLYDSTPLYEPYRVWCGTPMGLTAPELDITRAKRVVPHVPPQPVPPSRAHTRTNGARGPAAAAGETPAARPGTAPPSQRAVAGLDIDSLCAVTNDWRTEDMLKCLDELMMRGFKGTHWGLFVHLLPPFPRSAFDAATLQGQIEQMVLQGHAFDAFPWQCQYALYCVWSQSAGFEHADTVEALFSVTSSLWQRRQQAPHELLAWLLPRAARQYGLGHENTRQLLAQAADCMSLIRNPRDCEALSHVAHKLAQHVPGGLGWGTAAVTQLPVVEYGKWECQQHEAEEMVSEGYNHGPPASLQSCLELYEPHGPHWVYSQRRVRALQQIATCAAREHGEAAAEPYLRKAKRIAEQELGPTHQASLMSLGLYARHLMDVGAPERALPLVQRMIKLTSEALGPRHMLTFMGQVNMGHVLFILGRFTQAEPVLKDTYEESMRALGGAAQPTLLCVSILYRLLRRVGKHREARKFRADSILEGFVCSGFVDKTPPDDTLAVHLSHVPPHLKSKLPGPRLIASYLEEEGYVGRTASGYVRLV